jgi:predicted nucleotidyltransferase
MLFKPKPEHPIDPITRSVIKEVKSALTELRLDAFLIGATARIILLEHVCGLPAGRASRDTDFAFAVETWDQFQAIKDRLTSTGRFREAGNAVQRLIYKPESERYEFLVDLLPFGGIEISNNTVAWPPDMGVVMNVAGFRDAHASAVDVEIEPGLVISVASIPGIAVLKLFAWNDRRNKNPKDALDLVTLLRQYHEAGNTERIFEEETSALEAVDYDIELAGAWLLGRDASTLASKQTREQISNLLNDTPLTRRMVDDMARALLARDDALDYANTLLEQFRKGFTDQTTTTE